MAYKDLLVHQSDDDQSAKRLDVAVALAQRLDAHVTGVYVLNYPVVPGFVQAEVPAEIIEQRYEEMRQAAAKRRKAGDERLARDGVKGEFRVMEGDPVDAVAMCARYSDLVIAGQPDPDHPDVQDRVAEGLVMSGGRPVLVVPYAGPAKSTFKRVMVAWNGTREATRALHDALPFLKEADDVIVYGVNPEDADHIAGADISVHLSRHGVKAEPKHIVAPDLDVEDALLSATSDNAIDLLVMGAYGHSRLRELVLGGATRGIFRSMTCPVVLSH